MQRIFINSLDLLLNCQPIRSNNNLEAFRLADHSMKALINNLLVQLEQIINKPTNNVSGTSMVQEVLSYIQIYFRTMKNMYESAVEKHLLQSVLPHPTYPVQKPVLKTKDFYRPEQFIWNNPHRASHQMYKFYHAYNENYLRHKQPLLRERQNMDREEAERERIERLIVFRNKTRDEFVSKKKSREKLESKVHQYSRLDTKSIKTDHNILGLESQFNGLTQIEAGDDLSQRTSKSHKGIRVFPKSQRILKIEQTYKEGLKKYDIKTEEINRLIQDQNEEYHKKIRSQFLARKLTNDATNSKFYQRSKKNTCD